MGRKIAVIGSGISGLSAAAYSAQDGNEVHVFEKNNEIGGRARQFTQQGYTFDMGPSWYWMPDIIDNFFQDFGHQASDFYELVSLNPQFEMVVTDEVVAVPQDMKELKSLFERLEPGSGRRLDDFMQAAKYKYDVGMRDFVTKPCHTWLEFLSPKIAVSALKLDLLSNFRSYVAKYFKHPTLQALMEFPVIFLGASPKDIPALYSLMNYGGYALGTWYPMGGFHKLVLAMKEVGEQLGVTYHVGQSVERILTMGDEAHGLIINGQLHHFDAIISSADYQHTETLMEVDKRNYTDSYWESRTFAPSCLIYYLGFKRKIENLTHHTLFFENDLDAHIKSIYDEKEWPDKPLFYACCPSKTDPSVAPAGHENVFLLMPLATGIADNETIREKYFQEMIARLEKHTGSKDLLSHLEYKRSYCVSDFIQDYNAYQGNAYGLANTLRQTAVWKPSVRNKKIANLFYTGQLTVPGPGVPPALISGKIAANEVRNLINITV